MPVDIPVAGLPAPTLYGAGSPALLYSADVQMVGLVYLQTDAVPGARLWLCTYNANGGTFQWENLRAPLAVQSTATFSQTPIASLGSQSQTLTVPGAAVGMGVYCAIVGGPTSISLFPTGYVSAANSVVIQLNNSGLTSLTPANIVVRFFLF